MTTPRTGPLGVLSATGNMLYRDSLGDVAEVDTAGAVDGDILTRIAGLPAWQSASVALTNFFQYFDPEEAIFGAINGQTGIAGMGIRNKRPILTFAEIDVDPASNQNAVFSAVLPDDFDPALKNIQARVDFVGPDTVVVGDVVWNIAWERLEEDVDDIDADNFAAAKSVTKAVSATDGALARATIDFTSAEAADLVAGEAYRLQLVRDSDNVLDTLVGTADVLRVSLAEVAKP
jgi:hypothetical protein